MSFRYKLIDRVLALFLLVGLTAALGTRYGNAALMRTFAVTALSVYVLVSFYQAEWDVRVQLSAHVLLIPIATLGWLRLARVWRVDRMPVHAPVG